MKATVSTLYRNGRALPQNKFGKTVTGDLNLSPCRSVVDGSFTHEACVLSDVCCLLPTLSDAHVVCIAAHGMMLRGCERTTAGAQVVQEWWCRIEIREGGK